MFLEDTESESWPEIGYSFRNVPGKLILDATNKICHLIVLDS